MLIFFESRFTASPTFLLLFLSTANVLIEQQLFHCLLPTPPLPHPYNTSNSTIDLSNKVAWFFVVVLHMPADVYHVRAELSSSSSSFFSSAFSVGVHPWIVTFCWGLSSLWPRSLVPDHLCGHLFSPPNPSSCQ